MTAPVDDERLARIALAHAGELGNARLARLVAELGANELLTRLREERTLAEEVSPIAVKLRGAQPERVLESAQRRGLRFVIPGDAEWPTGFDGLAHAEDAGRHGGPPLGIWVRGNGRLETLTVNAVAVVGSRSATTYGAGLAGQIGYGLASTGTTVVSGAAFGIDQAAHNGALAARGPTLAVLACGVDRPYPVAHTQLLERICAEGAVISEQLPGSHPTRVKFLTRNRMIAALGAGTVVVEAALRSGALSTANWATRLNRVLMGVPGPVTSAASGGVHELIRGGRAMLVIDAAQVRELVSPAGPSALSHPRAPERPADGLTESELRMLDALPVSRHVTPGHLASQVNLVEAEARRALRSLARRGLAEERAGLWRFSPQRLASHDRR